MADADDFALTPHANDRLQRLVGWRGNVGTLVSLNATNDQNAVANNATVLRSLVVLSWNVWIGHGRLRELVSRIRNGEFIAHGADPDAPLVVLVQEAYREDVTLAQQPTIHVGHAPKSRRGHQREDIVEAAHALGMSLRYAPSMRNGHLQSDRGNAILSSLPLEEAQAFELPHAHQRRVAVAAMVRIGSICLRVVSAHLDPRGMMGADFLGMSGRALQMQHLLTSLRENPTVLGADLNIAGGRRELAWRLLRNAGFTMGIPSIEPTWRHTYHGMPRVLIDYLLFRDPTKRIAAARVMRLDEHPKDRGPLVFGSDHHPLLAYLHFADAGEGDDR